MIISYVLSRSPSFSIPFSYQVKILLMDLHQMHCILSRVKKNRFLIPSGFHMHMATYKRQHDGFLGLAWLGFLIKASWAWRTEMSLSEFPFGMWTAENLSPARQQNQQQTNKQTNQNNNAGDEISHPMECNLNLHNGITLHSHITRTTNWSIKFPIHLKIYTSRLQCI